MRISAWGHRNVMACKVAAAVSFGVKKINGPYLKLSLQPWDLPASLELHVHSPGLCWWTSVLGCMWPWPWLSTRGKGPGENPRSLSHSEQAPPFSPSTPDPSPPSLYLPTIPCLQILLLNHVKLPILDLFFVVVFVARAFNLKPSPFTNFKCTIQDCWL